MRRVMFVVFGALVFSGCSSSDDIGRDTTAVSESEKSAFVETTVETLSDGRMLVDTKEGSDPYERYLAYEEAYNVASGAPKADPNYKPLEELTTERQLKRDQSVLSDKLEIGVVWEYSKDSKKNYVTPSRVLPSEDEQEYSFPVCRVNDGFERNLVDGSRSPEGEVHITSWWVYMAKDDVGQWRVDEVNEIRYWHYDPNLGWAYKAGLDEDEEIIWKDWDASVEESLTASTIYPTREPVGGVFECSPELYDAAL